MAVQSSDTEERQTFARRWFAALQSPIAFLAAIVGLLAAYFAAVEWRVRSIVGDPEFRAEIARRVRPSLVFDSEGRVLTNTGALELLEAVPEVRKPSKGDVIFIVTIHPKAWLAAEPILESLDIGAVSVRPRRLKDRAWEVTVSVRAHVLGLAGQPTDVAPPRFRLELIAP